VHYNNFAYTNRCGLAPASNIEPCGRSPTPIPLPPPWDGEKNWKKKEKLMGWVKDSLTEQQRKRKKTIILIKRIY